MARKKNEPNSALRMWWLINAGLAVVLVVGIGASGWFGYHWYSAATQERQQTAAVDAAQEAVRALLKISPSTIDADLARGEELTTGELLEQWKKKEDTVRQSVKEQGATRTSKVIKAAYSKGDTDSATVLLAVDTTTKWDAPIKDEKGEPVEPEEGTDADGDGIPDPVTDHYRVMAEMSLVEGEWLMSSLDIA